jgi:hypothetical protein
VDFGSADIFGHFEAQEAQFKDKVKGTSFNSIKVDRRMHAADRRQP